MQNQFSFSSFFAPLNLTDIAISHLPAFVTFHLPAFVTFHIKILDFYSFLLFIIFLGSSISMQNIQE